MTSMQVHRLDGCAPAPLAHYLKALGILRLVSEQVDSNARGWWDGDHFRLATKLGRQELEEFFLYDYRPTPFVSPWNKGSGFFVEKSSGVPPLEKSTSSRFSGFRFGIEASHAQLVQLSRADKKIRDIKAEAKKNSRRGPCSGGGRDGFEEDYEELTRERNRTQKIRDRIAGLNSKDLDRAENRLKAAQDRIKDANEYRKLLDVRDAEETKFREANDKETKHSADRYLKDVFSQLKNSNNYKRRLNSAEKRFKLLKSELIPSVRLSWRGIHREWMDAAMVLADDGTPKFPALLGTGGNDGNLDFTNNFMKRIGEVFDLGSDDGKPRPVARAWVAGALWGAPVPGSLLGQPIGQYLPGTAGGANNGNGPESDSMVNPFDFILMLEGTIVFTSHATRRFGSSEPLRAASPFVVNACGAYYASASANDESARGEQWMPLWSHPSSNAELRRLLAEGRVQVGAKTAREPLDLARAVRRLGTARGIEAFQRYGYIERNGQSNLAVPLGRFDVVDGQSRHLACIDDLDLWLRRLRQRARDRNAPARLAAVEKRLVDALFAVTEHPHRAECWQDVLLRLGDLEAVMRRGSGYGAQPIPRLSPEWVAASYDGTPEFRLALAFALQARGFLKEKGTPIDPIRRHWLPLDPERPRRFATTGTGSATRLDMQPEVVMGGRRGLDDAVALVERRLVEAQQREGRHLPLRAPPRAAASIGDLTELLTGGVDLDRTLTLARPLMALDRKAWAEQTIPIEPCRTSEWPDEAWLAIRLCTLSWPLETRAGFKLDTGTDPAIVRRLAAGDAASAVALALRRLSGAGVRCTVRAGTTPSDIARLWAAALAFPITQGTARRLLYRLDPNKE